MLTSSHSQMTSEQIESACKDKLKHFPGVGFVASRFRDFISEYLSFLKRSSSTPGSPRSITAVISNLKHYNQQRANGSAADAAGGAGSGQRPADAEGWEKTYDAFALVVGRGASLFTESVPWFNDTLRFLGVSLLELAFQVSRIDAAIRLENRVAVADHFLLPSAAQTSTGRCVHLQRQEAQECRCRRETVEDGRSGGDRSESGAMRADEADSNAVAGQRELQGVLQGAWSAEPCRGARKRKRS